MCHCQKAKQCVIAKDHELCHCKRPRGMPLKTDHEVSLQTDHELWHCKTPRGVPLQIDYEVYHCKQYYSVFEILYNIYTFWHIHWKSIENKSLILLHDLLHWVGMADFADIMVIRYYDKANYGRSYDVLLQTSLVSRHKT